MTPSHLVIFLKGNLLRISSSLEVMLGFSFFAEFCLLELSRDDCWFHQVWCAWFILGLSKFSFLVNCLGSNFPCLLFLILYLARGCRACFRFYSILSFFFVSCGRRAIYFLVLYCLIRFDGTWSFFRGPWCRMFFFSDLSNVYWCGPGRIDMDGYLVTLLKLWGYSS